MKKCTSLCAKRMGSSKLPNVASKKQVLNLDLRNIVFPRKLTNIAWKSMVGRRRCQFSERYPPEKTNRKHPLEIGKAPTKKDRLPTTIFECAMLVSGRGKRVNLSKIIQQFCPTISNSKMQRCYKQWPKPLVLCSENGDEILSNYIGFLNQVDK